MHSGERAGEAARRTYHNLEQLSLAAQREYYDAYSDKQRCAMWLQLHATVHVALFRLDGFDGRELMCVLKLATRLALSVLGDAQQPWQPPSTLLPLVCALHGALLHLGAGGRDVLCLRLGGRRGMLEDAIARVCLGWWCHELPGREGLTSNLVPFLIERVLDPRRLAALLVVRDELVRW